MFSKLGTYLIVPRYLTASTKNYLAFGLSSELLLPSFALSKVLHFSVQKIPIDAPPVPDNTPDWLVSGIDKDRPE